MSLGYGPLAKGGKWSSVTDKSEEQFSPKDFLGASDM